MSDLCAICHERIPEGGDIRRGRSIQDSLATPHGLLARYKGLSASLGECGRPRPTDRVQKFMDWTRPQGVGKGREGGAFLPPPPIVSTFGELTNIVKGPVEKLLSRKP